LKTSSLFIDSFRYWPFRLFSEAGIRKYFARKAGQESGSFIYSNDLTKHRKRIVFLPSELSLLSVHVPLCLELSRAAKEHELVFVGDESYMALFKALGIEKFGWFYSATNLRYGDPFFKALELKIRSHGFDVALMLDSQPSLLQLYLTRASGAAIRIGMDCDKDYPFLNFCFHTEKSSPYSFRSHLQILFLLEDSHQDHPFAHKSSNLSSKQVILLNLEPSVDGHAWTVDEMTVLAQKIDPHYRLLALAPDPTLLEQWGPTLERLAIRSAPIATSFSAFLDLLRQYKGMISLNSAHAQLALNISHIPMILVHDPKLEGWLPQETHAWSAFTRGTPVPNDFYNFLLS